MEFKICVIGCGAMSLSGHGPSFLKYKNEFDGVKLKGCCDLDENRAKEYKEKFEFEKHYTDYNVMLDENKPDVVCLISPVEFTKNLSIQIMKKGYAVILEKPPGIDENETIDMMQVANEFNIPTRVAFNRRYMPLMKKLKKMIMDNSKSEGGLFNITYQMYRSNRIDKDFSTTTIHAIDAVKHLAGSEYKTVKFTYQELPAFGENVANIYMDCEFFSGTIAQISIITMGGVISERITANCHNKTFFLELPVWDSIDSPGRLRYIDRGNIVEDISSLDIVNSSEMYITNGFYDENKDFFNYLRNQNKVISNDLDTAIQSVQIANCIRKRITEKSFKNIAFAKRAF